MANIYGYSNCPIFLSPVGQFVEFCGAKFDDDHVAIELDIPEDKAKIQRYYDWSDFIYFLDEPDDFSSNKHNSVMDFGKDVLLSCDSMGDDEAYQIVVDELHKEWIIGTTDHLDRIDELHNGSGGENILRNLNFYI
jgi:hypothetical protein